MDERMKQAPWSPDEVASLNEFQMSGVMHPFTCPRSHIFSWTFGEMPEEWPEEDLYHRMGERLRIGHILLMATKGGWVCPHDLCDYTQDWAWDIMLDRSWEEHRW